MKPDHQQDVSRLMLATLRHRAATEALLFFLLSPLLTPGCLRSQNAAPRFVRLAPGWTAELVARVPQSYAGWDVEIGDADNDGANEILTTGCPDSRLYLFKKRSGQWRTVLLADRLAQQKPGMGLSVRVVDLNGDGRNEIALGTGQEQGGTALLYIFQLTGLRVARTRVCRPSCSQSAYTHGLACYDADQDGLKEIFSAYCGGGEIVRYDVNSSLTHISARLVHQLSGSGEEALLADVDNDGQPEFLTSNGFREGHARVEIFEFTGSGNLFLPPRLVLAGFDGHPCFYASLTVGDLDNDGRNELIVGWKRQQRVNRATLLVYRVNQQVERAYTLAYEDKTFDLAYFEKMLVVADADNDGLNELVVTTRGDGLSEHIASAHLGHVFLFEINNGKVHRTLLADFDSSVVESTWPAVGDADNDGRNEIVLATGKGDRRQAGEAYVLLLRHREENEP